MKTHRLLPLLAAACLLGCKDKSGLPPRAAHSPSETGYELAAFQIGMSAEAVQKAIRQIPNFRHSSGARPELHPYGQNRASLTAKPGQIDEGRPVEMKFTFQDLRLEQAELTYESKDEASRSNLYDRLRGNFIGDYAQATNHVLVGGRRADWMRSKEDTLLIYESDADERKVTLRIGKPMLK